MTDRQINIYFNKAVSYTDPDAFASDVVSSLPDEERTRKDVYMDTAGQIRMLWHVAKDPFKVLLSRVSMSQSKCSVRFCIPLRTVQHWCAGDREAPMYVRLMLAEAAGILKIRSPLNFGGK